jgi:hypothetical protein
VVTLHSKRDVPIARGLHREGASPRFARHVAPSTELWCGVSLNLVLIWRKSHEHVNNMLITLCYDVITTISQKIFIGSKK